MLQRGKKRKASKSMNYGELSSKVDILEFTETSDSVYEWLAIKTVWAKIEHQLISVIFSKHGVTARSAKLSMHSRPELTLHNALASPKSGHFFVTDINRDVPGVDTVSVAIIEPIECKIERVETVRGANNRPQVTKLSPLTFPGYITEKYIRQTQNEPMSYSETRYVLVTPKVIEIKTGDIVDVGGLKYEMVIPHLLDPHKNEFEILRRSDN